MDMALGRVLIVLGLLAIASAPRSAAASTRNSIGVNYGRQGNNLPSPEQAVQLLVSTGIGKVKLFDADAGTLQALAHTGVEATITFPNDQIYAVGRRPVLAYRWVRKNVLPFIRAGTRIAYICVGNEILINVKASGTRVPDQLVPAMINFHSALVHYGLDKGTKVSTPHALNILNPSNTPSTGTFRGELMPYLSPMLRFLNNTGAPLMVNAYPYFAYTADPRHVNLDYALFRKNSGVRDSKSGLRYTSMLDAQIDTVHAALTAAGFSNVRVSVTETGWPSGGTASEFAATPANAASYNGGLIQRIRSGRGTPLRPKVPLEAFIFALFDENVKTGPESEHHYGLFHADMSLSYDAGLQRKPMPVPAPSSSPSSWCVSNPQATTEQLQAALNWACGQGKADCSAIQPGSPCYNPNTLAAHASYAFNSYYQKNGRQAGACVFSGAATITRSNPSYQGCSYPA